MTRTQPRPVIPMEVLIEQDIVPPVRVGLELLGTTVYRPSAGSSRRKIRVSRSEISLATSKRFISFPEPVGHSIYKGLIPRGLPRPVMIGWGCE